MIISGGFATFSPLLLRVPGQPVPSHKSEYCRVCVAVFIAYFATRRAQKPTGVVGFVLASRVIFFPSFSACDWVRCASTPLDSFGVFSPH